MFSLLKFTKLLLFCTLLPSLIIGQTVERNFAQLIEDSNFDRLDFQLFYYQKSKLIWTSIPFEIPGVSSRFIPSIRDTGTAYVEERIGRIEQLNGKLFERVDSISSAGSIRHFQWLEVRDLLWDWTESYINIPGLSTAPLSSPLAVSQIQNYSYEPITDKSVAIAPRDGVYHGFRGEVQWSDSKSYSSQFTTERKEGLKLSDSLICQYTQKKGVPEKLSITVYFSVLGYKGIYTNEVWFRPSEKLINRDGLPESCLLIWTKSSDTVVSPDVSRRHALSKDEAACINEEILFQEEKKKKAFRDSIQKHEYKILYASSLYTGGEIKTSDKSQITYRPIWYGLGLNTIEGLYYVARPKWVYDWRSDQAKFFTDLRYGFGDKRFRWRTGFQFAHLGTYRYTAELSFGRYISQFNDLEPIQAVLNSIYTLFGDNYLKIYERDFIRLNFESEPIVGLVINPKLELARRSALFNLNQYQDKGDYTPNNLFYPGVIDPIIGFRSHDALTFSLDLSYQFGQKYRVIRGRRRDEHSNLPKVYAEYSKGIKINDNSTDFDFLTLGLGAETDWGRWGFSRIDLSSGGFMNINRVEFIDFKHFNGIQTIFLQSTLDQWSSIRQFGTLPYYDFSTSRSFVEFHVDHDFRGTLWKEVPLLGHLNWSVISGVNYLYTDEYGNFTELFFGLDRMFGLFRFQLMVPLPRPQNARFPLRFGLTVNYNFYWKNRRR